MDWFEALPIADFDAVGWQLFQVDPSDVVFQRLSDNPVFVKVSDNPVFVRTR